MDVFFIKRGAAAECDIQPADLWLFFTTVRDKRGEVSLLMKVGSRPLFMPLKEIDAERTFGNLIRRSYKTEPPSADLAGR